MVRLEKHGDSAVRFIFTDSDHYLYKDGVVDVPVNSLSLVIDESEMVTFKKASTGDPFISFRLDKSNFSSRDELLTFYKENMVGAGGISEEEVQEMIDAATSGIPSSEVVEQLRTDVNAVSGEVDTLQDDVASKADASALTAVNDALTGHTANTNIHVTSTDKSNWDAKQDALTAGEHITISGNVISAEAGNNIIELTQAEYDALETKDPDALYIITDAQEINMNDYYTKSEVDASIATKADASALTAVNNALTAHTADTNVHVTQAEKNAWNGKVDTTTYESGQYATAQALNALQENKLDASAYTPTDLSEYWTSGQTQSAIDAATSGIPSSQVIEQLRTDVNTLSGDVQTNAANIADLVDTIDAKEEVIASALTQLNQDVAEIDAKEEVIASALTEVNLTLDNKLDASAYTPTDLSNYYTKGETDGVVNGAVSGKADTSAVTAVSDALTAHTANTTVHVTSAEKNTWNGKADASALTSIESAVTNVQSGLTAVSNDLNTLSGAVIDNEYTVSQAINSLNNRVTAVESTKQDTLVSGTNIKTINGESILGEGNITIEGGGGGGTGLDDDTQQLISTALNDLNDRKADLTELSKYQKKGDYVKTSTLADYMTNASFDEYATAKERIISGALNDLNDKFGGLRLVKISQAEYDALATKDSSTLYIISD